VEDDMSALPWILISVVAGILVVLAIAVMLWKRKDSAYFRKDTDYKAFFWMGLVWVIVGGPVIWLYGDFSLGGLFAMGVIFMAMGLANRDKWGKRGKISKQQAKHKVIAVIAAILLVLAGIIAFELFYFA
jgi:uncharacterized membrane protein YidH (DUF202 family)